jgi:small GTP-binding protein
LCQGLTDFLLFFFSFFFFAISFFFSNIENACADPTIEDTYRKQVVIDQQACLLEILDTAGQDQFQTLRAQWIRQYDSFIIVYSITDRGSFEGMPAFHKQILRAKESEAVPMVLVGNKSDLDSKRQVQLAEGQALAQQLGAEFRETSAKTRSNVDDAFFTAVRLIWKYFPQEGHKQKKRLQCTLL